MNNDNPFTKLLSNSAAADEAIADLLKNEPPEKSESWSVKLTMIFVWHLFLSGLIATIVFHVTGISDVAAAIVFTGCMIHSLHRGILSFLIESRNQTKCYVELVNVFKACVLTINKRI